MGKKKSYKIIHCFNFFFKLFKISFSHNIYYNKSINTRVLSGTALLTNNGDSSAAKAIKCDRHYLTHSLVVQNPDCLIFLCVVSICRPLLPWTAYSLFYLPPTSCVSVSQRALWEVIWMTACFSSLVFVLGCIEACASTFLVCLNILIF